MNFELYSSKEDCINKKNTISSSIEELLDLYENGNEVMICSDGFDIKDRILLGIPIPLLILSNQGVYSSYTQYLLSTYKERKFILNKYFFRADYLIDDIPKNASKVIYPINSEKIQTDLFSFKISLVVPGEEVFINSLPNYMQNLFNNELVEKPLVEKDLLRTSLVQRIFQNGKVFYTQYYRNENQLGDFFRALVSYIDEREY